MRKKDSAILIQSIIRRKIARRNVKTIQNMSPVLARLNAAVVERHSLYGSEIKDYNDLFLKMDKDFYITTPIYYPSAKPHMGHAYSSIVADFFARFKRISEHNVFFLTGTDEHGQKIQRAALEAKKDTLDFCNEISSNFKDLSAVLNLSNDDFIRTTEKRHKKAVENLWNILEKKNEIYLSKYSGWYSVSDEAFYSENEIEDKDNVKVNKLSGSKVEWVEEESFFFKL